MQRDKNVCILYVAYVKCSGETAVCLCIFLLKASKLTLLKFDTGHTIQYNTIQYNTTQNARMRIHFTLTHVTHSHISTLPKSIASFLRYLLIILSRIDKHVYVRRYTECQGNDYEGYHTYFNITTQTAASKGWR
jgi:hypothetical protein